MYVFLKSNEKENGGGVGNRKTGIYFRVKRIFNRCAFYHMQKGTI